MVYNLELINDYIDGNDLEGYNIDELEDDLKFMKAVIIVSKDKNFYNLCSENLKHNYEFVDFLITKFSYDYKFIDEVAKNYIKNCDNEDDKVCIVIKMCNIIKKSKDESLFAKYRVLFLSKFVWDMVPIETYRVEHPNDYKFGLGFIIFFDKYNSNEEVLKYYAKSMINYIFDDLNVNLEKKLHLKYKNIDEIYKNGIVKFMTDFIRRYDAILADYACVHTDILKEFQQRINNIKIKWNYYTDKEEKNKYLLMYERVHEYMQDHEFETLIGECGFIYYIGKELRITDKLAAYSGLDKKTYEEMNDDIECDFVRITLSDYKERIFYMNIRRIMLETLFDEYKEQNNDVRIVEFKFNK